VICGLPLLYEYEHLDGWANVHQHEEHRITLLCDRHHREKTTGLLPLTVVEEANGNPFNLRAGVTKPYDLYFEGNACEALVGSNRFVTEDRGYGTAMIPVSIDGDALLGFLLTDGHLLLNLALFDEYNRLVLQIRNNQLWHATDIWDVQLIGRRLLVRQAARQLLLDIRFEPPNRIVIDRGRFLRNGVEVLITPKYVLVTNNNMLVSGSEMVNCVGGIVIGPHTQELGGFLRIEGVPRYLGDRAASKRWADEMFAQVSGRLA
jgi:trigger factor